MFGLVCPALEDEAEDAICQLCFWFGALEPLNNVLDNAFFWLQVRWPEDIAKPSPKAIYINIDLDYAEGPAIIVADTGPGFIDDPERLTRPFFSRRPDGMGIGLYYTNLVMEMNGGRLAFPDSQDAEVPEKFDGAVLALVFDVPRKK